jgi:hypothetical protein
LKSVARKKTFWYRVLFQSKKIKWRSVSIRQVTRPVLIKKTFSSQRHQSLKFSTACSKRWLSFKILLSCLIARCLDWQQHITKLSPRLVPNSLLKLNLLRITPLSHLCHLQTSKIVFHFSKSKSSLIQ